MIQTEKNFMWTITAAKKGSYSSIHVCNLCFSDHNLATLRTTFSSLYFWPLPHMKSTLSSECGLCYCRLETGSLSTLYCMPGCEQFSKMLQQTQISPTWIAAGGGERFSWSVVHWTRLQETIKEIHVHMYVWETAINCVHKQHSVYTNQKTWGSLWKIHLRHTCC